MSAPRTVTIDGRRYAWSALVALRRAQAQAQERPPQPTLFALRTDRRPAGERSAAERYAAPSLFTLLDQKETPTE